MKKIVRVGIGEKETVVVNSNPPKHIDWYDVELSDEYMDDEDGDGKLELCYEKGITVKCLTPGLTAAISQGETEDEAVDNIIDCIQLVKEVIEEDKQK